jgi:hypothetical protein
LKLLTEKHPRYFPDSTFNLGLTKSGDLLYFSVGTQTCRFPGLELDDGQDDPFADEDEEAGQEEVADADAHDHHPSHPHPHPASPLPLPLPPSVDSAAAPAPGTHFCSLAFPPGALTISLGFPEIPAGIPPEFQQALMQFLQGHQHPPPIPSALPTPSALPPPSGLPTPSSLPPLASSGHESHFGAPLLPPSPPPHVHGPACNHGKQMRNFYVSYSSCEFLFFFLSSGTNGKKKSSNAQLVLKTLDCNNRTLFSSLFSSLFSFQYLFFFFFGSHSERAEGCSYYFVQSRLCCALQ